MDDVIIKKQRHDDLIKAHAVRYMQALFIRSMYNNAINVRGNYLMTYTYVPVLFAAKNIDACIIILIMKLYILSSNMYVISLTVNTDMRGS